MKTLLKIYRTNAIKIKSKYYIQLYSAQNGFASAVSTFPLTHEQYYDLKGSLAEHYSPITNLHEVHILSDEIKESIKSIQA